MLLRVESPNICASVTSAVASNPSAIIVSASEKPASLLNERDFSKSVHRDGFNERALDERDCRASGGYHRPGRAAPVVLVHAAVRPELQRGRRAEGDGGGKTFLRTVVVRARQRIAVAAHRIRRLLATVQADVCPGRHRRRAEELDHAVLAVHGTVEANAYRP